MPELVRQCHQSETTKPRLHILLGLIFFQAGKDLFELALQDLKRLLDWDNQSLDAKIPGETICIVETTRGGVRARHRHPGNILLPERFDGNCCSNRGVNPTAQPEHCTVKPALGKIIAYP